MKLKRVLALALAGSVLFTSTTANASGLVSNANQQSLKDGAARPVNNMLVGENADLASGQVIDKDALAVLDGVYAGEDAVVSKNDSTSLRVDESNLVDETIGKVQFEGIDSSDVKVDLKTQGVKDEIQELKDQKIQEDEMVRVIILMDGDSIVEKDSEAELDNSTLKQMDTMESKQEAILDKIENRVLEGEELDVRYQYTWLVNGVATEVPYGKIDEIEAIKGVDSVVLQEEFEAPTSVAAPYTIADDAMIGREDTWADGYTGQGMKISIIDTGLDDDHQNFAAMSEDVLTDASVTKSDIAAMLDGLNAASLVDNFSVDKLYRSNKVVYGFNYVDSDYRINHQDSMGDHGTHVAGISAANDLRDTNEASSVGVAKDAQLYIMKVFGSNGGAYTEDIVASLEDSLMLGVDVVNMSLGSPCGFSESGNDLFDQVYDTIATTGTIVAVAAGNSATSGDMNMWGTNTNLTSNPDNSMVSSPATYANVTSVASVENIGNMGYYLEVGGNKISYSNGNNGTNPPLQKELGGQEVAYAMVGNCGQTAEDFAAADVEGKIAVVQRGITAFTAKAALAQEAGAIACIIYNNVAGTIGLDLSNSDLFIPVVSISMQSGEFLKAHALEFPEDKMLLSEKTAIVPSETAWQMSDFTSWGVSPDLSLEPDVAGPGGNIYSTIDNGEYGLMSGTSMASPNVAGVSALILQYVKTQFPDKAGSEIRDFANQLMVSTAVPLNYNDKLTFSPRVQGSGLVNAYNAVRTNTYLTVDGRDVPKAELYDDPEKTGEYSYSFHVKNFGDEDSYYALSTNAQTEDYFEDEYTGKTFMAMKPIALDAETAEASDALVFTYDYNEDGRVDASDADRLSKLIAEDKVNGLDAFRFDVNGDEEVNEADVKALRQAVDDNSALVSQQILKVTKGTSVDVTVSVKVTEKGKKYMDDNFENGIYVEGYTMLEALTEGGIDLSIPYLGFYGDWTKAPIIDSGYYWEDEETMEASQYVNVLFTNYASSSSNPGLNPYLNVDDFDPAHISLSPNGDGYGDYLIDMYVSLLRNAGEITFSYVDAKDGTIYFSQTIPKMTKSYLVQSYNMIIPFVYSSYVTTGDIKDYYFIDADGNYLPNDTKPNLVISTSLDYDKHEQNNVCNQWVIPITIDTQAPEIKEMHTVTDETTGKVELEMTFTDNVGIAAMNFVSKRGTTILAQYPVDDFVPGEDCTMRFDITGFGNEFQVIPGDYAFNENPQRVYVENNDPILDENVIYGYRVYDENYNNDALFGWVTIDPQTAEITPMSSEWYMDYAITAAEYVGGYIMAVDANKTLYAIKPGYWDERIQIAKLGVNIRELAFDQTTNTLYAYNSEDNVLCTIDIASGKISKVSDEYLYSLRTMTCTNDGTLYGIDDSGLLMTIDKEMGVWGDTILNLYDTTGFYPSNGQSMTYDATTNSIYWGAYSFNYFWGATSILYRYDLEKKELVKVNDVNGKAEIVGLLKLNNNDFKLPTDASIEAVELKQTSVKMLPNDEEQMDMILVPWYGKGQEFTWTSSNEEVATVSSKGLVSSIAEGTTVITVANEDESLKASCKVEVILPRAELNGFVMIGNSLQNQWVNFAVDDFDNYVTKTEPDYLRYYSGEYYDGAIYAYSSATELYKIDPVTYEKKKISDHIGGAIMVDMAYNYADGYMYGILQDTAWGSTSLVRIDLITGAFDVVAELRDEFGSGACGLAISTSGEFYVITMNGILYSFDLENAELAQIGYSGFAASPYTQCMAYDHNKQELYWAMMSATGEVSIMYMDTDTGAAIALGTVDNGVQMVAMYSAPLEEIPKRQEVAVDSVDLELNGGVLTLLEGGIKTIPVSIRPFNATDRHVDWTVSDESVAVVEDNQVIAKKAGTTSVSGTIGSKKLSFEVQVKPAAGDMYGYILMDFDMGGGQFWGSFKDNNLAEGNGIADATNYEVYAGTYYNGKIYGYGVDTTADYAYQYMVINPGDENTFEIEYAKKLDNCPDMLDLTYDYTQGTMYAVGGVMNVEGNTTLYNIDLATGAYYAVAKLDARIMALTTNDLGQMFGVDENGDFYSINKDNGELTYISSTGLGVNLYTSMAYDYNSGNIYWAQAFRNAMTWEMSASLVMLDPVSGSTMNLGQISTAGVSLSSLYTLPKEQIKEQKAKATKILINTNKESMAVGASKQLEAVAYPLNTENAKAKFSYSSSNAAVATVDDTGLITAVAAGKATIYVRAGELVEKVEISVASDCTNVYAVNTKGFEIAGTFTPDSIKETQMLYKDMEKDEAEDSDSEEVDGAEDAEDVEKADTLSIVTATYDKKSHFFYAIGEDGYLWRFTEDTTLVEKVSQVPVNTLLDNYAEFEEGARVSDEPVVVDIEANAYNGKLYALVKGWAIREVDGAMTLVELFFIYEMDEKTGACKVVEEIGEAVGAADEFTFCAENECYVYDSGQDYIFKMNLTTGALNQVAWAQSIMVSGDHNGLAYNDELDLLFIATDDYFYNNGMTMFVFNPNTSTVSKFSDAVYSPDMVDIMFVSKHVEAEPVRENVKEATRWQEGSHDEVVYCSECGLELSRVTVTDPKVEVPPVVEAVATVVEQVVAVVETVVTTVVKTAVAIVKSIFKRFK